MVEFAFVVTLLALVLVGTLDLGRVFYDYERLANAAREGAFWRASNPSATLAEVAAHVQAEAGYVPSEGDYFQCDDGNPPTVAFLDPSGPTDPRVGMVGIEVTCQFRVITPLLAAATGNPINLRTEAWAPR